MPRSPSYGNRGVAFVPAPVLPMRPPRLPGPTISTNAYADPSASKPTAPPQIVRVDLSVAATLTLTITGNAVWYKHSVVTSTGLIHDAITDQINVQYNDPSSQADPFLPGNKTDPVAFTSLIITIPAAVADTTAVLVITQAPSDDLNAAA